MERNVQRDETLDQMVKRLGCVSRRTIQKLVYIFQEGYKVPTGYRFKNIHGVTSSELDSDLDHLKILGYTKEEDQPNRPGTLITSADAETPHGQKLPPDWQEPLDQLLRDFSGRGEDEMATAADVLFLRNVLNEDVKTTVLEHASRIWPRTPAETIAGQYDELDTLGLFKEPPTQRTHLQEKPAGDGTQILTSQRETALLMKGKTPFVRIDTPEGQVQVPVPKHAATLMLEAARAQAASVLVARTQNAAVHLSIEPAEEYRSYT